MKALLERELKFAPPPDLNLSALGGEHGAARDFESTYYDTPGRELLRHGVTLRRRVEGDGAAWQLKLPAGGARRELELDGDGAPPEEALRLLVGLTRRRPIGPVARLRTRRETVHVRRDGVHVADVVVDAVTVLDGEQVLAAFDELEVELVDGDEKDLRKLGRALRAAGAEDAPAASKLARALGVAPTPAPVVEAPPSAVLAAALRTQLEQILQSDPGTRAGIDAEDLHQFRVATRRLRAFLRAGSELVERGWADGLREEIGWLGGLLGDVRDHDVLIERLRSEAADLDPEDRDALEPLFDALEREREATRGELIAGLESDRYLDLLARLESEEPPLTGAEPALRSVWRREFRRVGKAVSALTANPPDEELHAVRIHVKRARYAAELAAPELGKQGAAFVEAAKELQDVLGDHQDAVVAEQVLRRLAPEFPEARLALGRLVERERGRRAAARADWRAAWARLEKRAKALGG